MAKLISKTYGDALFEAALDKQAVVEIRHYFCIFMSLRIARKNVRYSVKDYSRTPGASDRRGVFPAGDCVKRTLLWAYIFSGSG